MVGDDASSVVLPILQGHSILPKLTHTFITLILKKIKSITMVDFQSISLCNVIYKLVTKIISNKVKCVLLGIIFDTQLAFTLEKLIMDNVICAFKMSHAMKWI